MDTKLFAWVVGGSGIIATTFFLCTAFGLWIDRSIGTGPWGIAIGMILAFALVIIMLYSFYKKMNEKK